MLPIGSSMLPIIHILSLPGWVLGAMSTHACYEAIQDLYDPSEFIQQFQTNDLHDAKLIAFMSIVCNLYDFTAAMQDNWGMFGISLATRAAAAALFYSFGTEEWRKSAVEEVVTFGGLAIAMVLSASL